MMRISAPAKVNLYLAVGEAGPDGYHPVETVLQSLDFGDTVTLSRAATFAFTCSEPLGIPDENNLAFRAALAMSRRFKRALDVAVAIEKRIPAGAGLGGASADAAAVIVGLAELWGVGGDVDALHELARSLGADVPFFLKGGAARFTGRGDVFARALPPLGAPIVVARPPLPVPTAAAYAAFDRLGAPASPSLRSLEDALASGDAAAVARLLHNAMTPSSVTLVPAITDALDLVVSSPGVLGAAMAGSGSAVFGVCTTAAHAEACALRAREAGLWGVATRGSASGCAIERP